MLSLIHSPRKQVHSTEYPNRANVAPGPQHCLPWEFGGYWIGIRLCHWQSGRGQKKKKIKYHTRDCVLVCVFKILGLRACLRVQNTKNAGIWRSCSGRVLDRFVQVATSGVRDQRRRLGTSVSQADVRAQSRDLLGARNYADYDFTPCRFLHESFSIFLHDVSKERRGSL